MAYRFVDGRIGAQPIGNTDSTQNHPLGTVVRANDPTFGEGTFIYVQASNSITQYDAVAIKAGYKAVPLTITNGKLAVELAYSQVAVGTKGDYFWVNQGGRPMVRLALATQPNVPLFATATGGVLDDASSSVVIQGIQAETQVTNSAGPATCVVRFATAHHEPPG
jgi:hypothetical protein